MILEEPVIKMREKHELLFLGACLNMGTMFFKIEILNELMFVR